MSIEKFDAVMEEMNTAIANAKTPEEVLKIQESFESKIDSAESALEAAFDAEIGEADKALEKQFRESIVEEEVEEIEPHVQDEDDPQPNSSESPISVPQQDEEESDLVRDIISMSTNDVARKYKRSEFVELAKSLNVEYRRLKEIDVVQNLKNYYADTSNEKN